MHKLFCEVFWCTIEIKISTYMFQRSHPYGWKTHFSKLPNKEKHEEVARGRHARAERTEFQQHSRDFLKSYHKKRWFKLDKCTHILLVGQLILNKL